MPALVLSLTPTISAIDQPIWDKLANPDKGKANPFLCWDFLQALEQTGCVGGQTGWQVCHLCATDELGEIAGVVPLYLKSHSMGEYVFDHGWAHAYEQAGGQYYPKLQSAVPFTPVTGARLLAGSVDVKTTLAQGLRQAVQDTGASSVHVTFTEEDDMQILEDSGFARRSDVQYHFLNQGYDDYEAFLASLSSRKRKNLRKERARAQDGIKIARLRGDDLKGEHWDAFYAFYQNTGMRKWGQPYLTREFFEEIHHRMRDQVLLVMASLDGGWIAGALNFIGGNTIYGRYWGCRQHHPGLHFELCYHQAIEAAITMKFARVEAGAQGEHKIARGYVPVQTHSAHFFYDPGMHESVKSYLEQERVLVDQDVMRLDQHTPFRKNAATLSLLRNGD